MALVTNCVGSSLAVGIFIYVAQTIERVLAVALGTNYAGSSLAGGIFLYVAQVVYRVTGVSFWNRLRWFESHNRQISLFTPVSWTRVKNSLLKLTVLVLANVNVLLIIKSDNE